MVLSEKINTTYLDIGKVVSYTLTNLTAGTQYSIAATEYDGFGNEGGYSNEVTVTIPAAAAELATTPARPSGPATGVTGVAYSYKSWEAMSLRVERCPPRL